MTSIRNKSFYLALGLTTCAFAKVAYNRSKLKKATKKENREEANPDKSIFILQPNFDKASIIAKTSLSRSSLSQNDQLMMYGLYKQALEGDSNTKKAPSKLNVVAWKKYDAWSKFKGMPRHFAMMKYIEVVEHFVDLQGGEHLQGGEQKKTGGNEVGSSAMLDLAMDGDDIVYEDEDEVNFSDDDDLSLENSTTHGDDNYIENTYQSNELSLSAKQSTLGGTETNALRDTLGERSLFQAASTGNVALMQEMVQNGSVDEKDEYGQCPLHLAADHGSIECVNILLKAGGDYNATDNSGISVLEAAVIGGNVDVVRMLLKAGADPDHVDHEGDSPRTCAEDDEDIEMQNLMKNAPGLLKKGHSFASC